MNTNPLKLRDFLPQALKLLGQIAGDTAAVRERVCTNRGGKEEARTDVARSLQASPIENLVIPNNKSLKFNHISKKRNLNDFTLTIRTDDQTESWKASDAGEQVTSSLLERHSNASHEKTIQASYTKDGKTFYFDIGKGFFSVIDFTDPLVQKNIRYQQGVETVNFDRGHELETYVRHMGRLLEPQEFIDALDHIRGNFQLGEVNTCTQDLEFVLELPDQYLKCLELLGRSEKYKQALELIDAWKSDPERGGNEGWYL